jgi:hypothetical protein
MNHELSTILKTKLAGLPFLDLVCGMVQTQITDDPIGEEGATVQKKIPVTYDHNEVACKGKEIHPIPDSSKKSIIYFEDFGIGVQGKERGLTKFQSSLRLICWMNRSKLTGNHYTPVAGRAMAAIIQQIANQNPFSSGLFQRTLVRVARIPPQDIGLFGRYTYNEKDRQILRPPFEFFGIDFSIDFSADSKCLEGITWNTQSCS